MILKITLQINSNNSAHACGCNVKQYWLIGSVSKGSGSGFFLLGAEEDARGSGDGSVFGSGWGGH